MNQIFKNKTTKWVSIALSVALIGLLVTNYTLLSLWPNDRFLPLSWIGSNYVGFTDYQDVLTDLDKQLQQPIKLHGPKTSLQTSYKQLGVSVDNDKSLFHFASLQHESKSDFFGLLKKQHIDQQISLTYKQQKTIEIVDKIEKVDSYTAKNAELTIGQNGVILKESSTGRGIDQGKLIDSLNKLDMSGLASQITVQATILEPMITTEKAQSAKTKAEQVTGGSIILKTSAGVVEVPGAEIATSLSTEFIADKLQLKVNRDRLSELLSAKTIQLNTTSKNQLIQFLDGAQVLLEPGRSATRVDVVALTNKITASIESDAQQSATFDVPVSVIAPKVVIDRSYTPTQKGLDALLSDLTKNTGAEVSISIIEVGGRQRISSSRGTARYHPASTYKLFVSYSLLKRIDEGSVNWGDSATEGKTIRQCFDTMIINSNNSCAIWFGRTFGWSTIDSEVKAIGLNGITMHASQKSVNSTDEARFLQMIAAGQILSEGSRSILVDAMSKQVYRRGIPAGANNARVADKVGFLWALLHDAAIVYGPNSNYVIVILTDKSSWGEIASISRQVNDLMQR